MKNSSNCQTWVNWNWQECYVKNSQRSFAFEIGFLCVAAQKAAPKAALKLLTRSDFFLYLCNRTSKWSILVLQCVNASRSR